MRRIVDNLRAWIQRSNDTLIELIVGIIAVNVCIIVPGMFISGSILTFCLGGFLGLAYAIFMVVHMTATIEESLDVPEEESSKYAKRGYAIRLVVTIAVIIIGLRVTLFHFVAVFLGMMSIKPAVWLNPLIHKIMTKKKSKGR